MPIKVGSMAFKGLPTPRAQQGLQAGHHRSVVVCLLFFALFFVFIHCFFCYYYIITNIIIIMFLGGSLFDSPVCPEIKTKVQEETNHLEGLCVP